MAMETFVMPLKWLRRQAPLQATTAFAHRLETVMAMEMATVAQPTARRLEAVPTEEPAAMFLAEARGEAPTREATRVEILETTAMVMIVCAHQTMAPTRVRTVMVKVIRGQATGMETGTVMAPTPVATATGMVRVIRGQAMEMTTQMATIVSARQETVMEATVTAKVIRGQVMEMGMATEMETQRVIRGQEMVMGTATATGMATAMIVPARQAMETVMEMRTAETREIRCGMPKKLVTLANHLLETVVATRVMERVTRRSMMGWMPAAARTTAWMPADKTTVDRPTMAPANGC
jgi:hypothetical protein